MTTFNPRGKELLTRGECLSPAMTITDQGDADQYLAAYIAYVQMHLDREPRSDDMTAEQIVKDNLGYYAGYYDSKTRERVERLFRCAHPVFGSIAENGQPSAAKAFKAGLNAANPPHAE